MCTRQVSPPSCLLDNLAISRGVQIIPTLHLSCKVQLICMIFRINSSDRTYSSLLRFSFAFLSAVCLLSVRRSPLPCRGPPKKDTASYSHYNNHCRHQPRIRRRSHPHPGSILPSSHPWTSRTRSRFARPSHSADAQIHVSVPQIHVSCTTNYHK